MKLMLFIEIAEHREPELQYIHPRIATWEGEQLEPYLLAEAVAAEWYPGLAASETNNYWTDDEIKIEVARFIVIPEDHFEVLSKYIVHSFPTDVGLEKARQFMPKF
jgi:hypothetical protein